MPTSSLPEHNVIEETPLHRCYQCGIPDTYLFEDGRCGDCTRLTPEEVRGEATTEEDI